MDAATRTACPLPAGVVAAAQNQVVDYELPW
jgi:hypothetical protein